MRSLSLSAVQTIAQQSESWIPRSQEGAGYRGGGQRFFCLTPGIDVRAPSVNGYIDCGVLKARHFEPGFDTLKTPA
jgi:hypothetical protein